MIRTQYFVKKYKLNKMSTFQQIWQIKKQEKINKIRIETLSQT